ncbi:hypothetical protein F7R13_34690 [Burkholderia territorii]|uniref:Uncharacterized protein n=1 Tax=Burkholderia territorii TaxID=1503055 RepID=A0A6L3MU67_9BURK|nr:hypothetical protein F7R13_34690 [Burkholderia territorii]
MTSTRPAGLARRHARAAPMRRDMDPFPARHVGRTLGLTPVFFRICPTFTHELLMIYFFVIWLDRQPGGGLRSGAAADGTGQQRQTNQCAESTAF